MVCQPHVAENRCGFNVLETGGEHIATLPRYSLEKAKRIRLVVLMSPKQRC